MFNVITLYAKKTDLMLKHSIRHKLLTDKTNNLLFFNKISIQLEQLKNELSPFC